MEKSKVINFISSFYYRIINRRENPKSNYGCSENILNNEPQEHKNNNDNTSDSTLTNKDISYPSLLSPWIETASIDNTTQTKTDQAEVEKDKTVSAENLQPASHSITDHQNITITPAPLSGHYSNKYVCVVQLEDGRIYVDYHYEKSDRPFGNGRVFGRINIAGVTTDKGKHIPGSAKKLKLVAIYPCTSMEEIQHVYESVYKEYEAKYPNVFRQKKFASETIKKKEKPTSDIKLKESIILPTDSLKKFYEIIISSNDSVVQDYFSNADFSDINYIIKDLIAPEYYATFQSSLSKKNIQNSSLINLDIQICWADYIMELQFSKINDLMVPHKDVDIILSNTDENTFCIDSCCWVPSSKYTRIRAVLGLNSIDFFTEGIKILSSSNLTISFEGLVYPLLEDQRKELLASFWIYKAFQQQLKRKIDYDANNWLSKKYFSFAEWIRYERRKTVTFILVDQEKKAAFVDGTKGIYYTDLNYCSCPDFNGRALFSPCKHMYALADTLNKKFNPTLNLALGDFPNPFFKIMFHGTNTKTCKPSCISTAHLSFWDYPLIEIPANNCTLYLGRKYGFLRSTFDIPDISVNALINGQKVGTVYKDEEMTMDKYCFRISIDANCSILEELANKSSLDVILKRKKEDIIVKEITIRDAFGVARLFNDLYFPSETVWIEND